MSKTVMMALALGLGASMAGAQTLTTSNGSLQITACYGIHEGVQCDALYFLTKKPTLNASFTSNDFMAVLPNGKQVKPLLSYGNKDEYISAIQFTAQANKPAKLSLSLDIPNTTTSIKSLTLGNAKIENVMVRPMPTPPAPAATTVAPPTNLAKWSASLTNCRQTNPDEMVCTATLKK